MPSYGALKAIYEDGQVTGMELIRCTFVKGESGRFNPRCDREETLRVSTDSTLMATGQKVDLSFLGDKCDLTLERGLIRVDKDTQATNKSGVYVGSDATTGPATVIQGVHSGCNAAKTIGGDYAVMPKRRREDKFIRSDTTGAKEEYTIKDKELSVAEWTLDRGGSFTLTGEEATRETGRYINCGCYSVNVPDISPVLILLDARIVTTKGAVRVADFFTARLEAAGMLGIDELVTAVQFRVPEGYTTACGELRVRETVDFAIVSLAYAYKMKNGLIRDTRIVLGDVTPTLIKRKKMGVFLAGRKPDGALIGTAAELAVEGTVVMANNSCKVQGVGALIEKTILDMGMIQV